VATIALWRTVGTATLGQASMWAGAMALAGIMAALAARTTDYQPASVPGPRPRYHRVIYLAAPAARSVTERAAATLPPQAAARVTIRDLPAGALL